MIAGFLKNLARVFALACILAAAYLNVVIVPDNHKTILVENTKGIQLPLLEPGYHWVWTRFVPLKWTIFNINTNPPAMNVSMHQALRYGRYMEDPDIFSFDITIKVKYRHTEKSVLFFWNYFNKDVNENTQYIHERVKLLLETYLADIYQREADVANFGILFRKYVSNEGQFPVEWQKVFSDEGVELLQYDIVQLEVPETAVYLENIKNIGRIFDARREATAKKIIADAVKYEKEVLDNEDLEKARKFGEIMQQYPDIVKYYQIEKINPKAKIVIQNQPSFIQPENIEPDKETAKPAPPAPRPAQPEPETGKIQPLQKQLQ